MARRPGISSRPAGPACWSSRSPISPRSWRRRARRAVFAVACSSPDNAGQSLPLHVDGPRSALDRDRMAPGAQAAYVIVVPTRTLDSILEEAEAPAPIDLLSIDVEGHEVEVLQRLRFQPLAAAADPDRGSRPQPAHPSHAEAARLPADPPPRSQRLVRAGRRPHARSRLRSGGKSCASIIWRCRSAKLRHASRRVRRLYADWQARALA